MTDPRPRGKVLILSHAAPTAGSPQGLDSSRPRAVSGFPARDGAWLAPTPYPCLLSLWSPGTCSPPEPRWGWGSHLRASRALPCQPPHLRSLILEIWGAGSSPALGKMGWGHLVPASLFSFCLPRSPRREGTSVLQTSCLCLRLWLGSDCPQGRGAGSWSPRLWPLPRAASTQVWGGRRVRAGAPLRSGWALAHPGSPPKCLHHC